MRATTLVKSANTEPLLKQGVRGKNKARISTSQSIVVVWFAIVVPPIRNTLDRTRLCVCPNSHAEVLNEFYYVRILWEQVPVEVKGGPPTLVTMDRLLVHA